MTAWFRMSLLAAGALAVLAGVGSAAGAQVQCARPNVPATVIRAVTPDMPALAQQQRISGTVVVAVTLDQDSNVTGTAIQSSPSAVLNAAALSAARMSTYQTEIRDCRPVASQSVYTVTFDSQPAIVGATALPPPGNPGARVISQNVTRSPEDSRPTVVITAQGVASRPPDVAYVNAGIVTNEDSSPTAVAKNDAAFALLQTKLAALGIDGSKIKMTGYNVSYTARPVPMPMSPSGAIATAAPMVYPVPVQRYGYFVSRQLQITADPAKIGAVIDAAVAAGATSVSNPQFGLADQSAAYNQALATALQSAKSQAAAVAAASGMHLGPVKQIQVQQQYMIPGPGPMRAPPNAITVAVSFPPPPTVDVRASVTVTYYLKP